MFNRNTSSEAGRRMSLRDGVAHHGISAYQISRLVNTPHQRLFSSVHFFVNPVINSAVDEPLPRIRAPLLNSSG